MVASLGLLSYCEVCTSFEILAARYRVIGIGIVPNSCGFSSLLAGRYRFAEREHRSVQQQFHRLYYPLVIVLSDLSTIVNCSGFNVPSTR
jgi:hypothetical protein